MNASIKSRFNLIRDPWIPIVDHDGQTRTTSLRELFEHASEIRDLACGPIERISLLRLFICIVQASQDPPLHNDSPDWLDFSSRLVSSALAYLDREDITPCFELFGDGSRFLQLPTNKLRSMRCSKLFLHLATGGNSTLHDHSGGDERDMEPAATALALLTFQNFSPLLGRGFKGRGLCVEGNAAHAFQIARTLAGTIVVNCLSLDAVEALCPGGKLGRPVWEIPPSPSFAPKAPETRNATESYLGRLVPLSRLVWILNRREVLIENGPPFPPVPAGREPSTCIIPDKKNAHSLLSLRLGRAAWRDLPAITMSQATGGSPTLQRGEPIDREIFIGGLITDFKARIEDSVISHHTNRLAVPSVLFAKNGGTNNPRQAYRSAMTAADTWGQRLWKALGIYFGSLKFDAGRTAGFRTRAQDDYWTFVGQGLPALFDILRCGEFLDPPLDNPDADSAWHRALLDAATRTYRLHTPRANARQLEAFCHGLRALRPNNPLEAQSGGPTRESHGLPPVPAETSRLVKLLYRNFLTPQGKPARNARPLLAELRKLLAPSTLHQGIRILDRFGFRDRDLPSLTVASAFAIHPHRNKNPRDFGVTCHDVAFRGGFRPGSSPFDLRFRRILRSRSVEDLQSPILTVARLAKTSDIRIDLLSLGADLVQFCHDPDTVLERWAKSYFSTHESGSESNT